MPDLQRIIALTTVKGEKKGSRRRKRRKGKLKIIKAKNTEAHQHCPKIPSVLP